MCKVRRDVEVIFVSFLSMPSWLSIAKLGGLYGTPTCLHWHTSYGSLVWGLARDGARQDGRYIW